MGIIENERNISSIIGASLLILVAIPSRGYNTLICMG